MIFKPFFPQHLTLFKQTHNNTSCCYQQPPAQTGVTVLCPTSPRAQLTQSIWNCSQGKHSRDSLNYRGEAGSALKTERAALPSTAALLATAGLGMFCRRVDLSSFYKQLSQGAVEHGKGSSVKPIPLLFG